jgi:hypothetical protein
MDREDVYRGLFDLVGYMLTSARGLIDEPQLYGPFRLIDGVSRLCGLLVENTKHGDFFANLKEKIDEGKFLVMTDRDAFVKLLDDAVLDYAKKMKEENQA